MATGQENLSSRRIATIVGTLFIIGTAAGVASGLVTAPILGESGGIAEMAAHENRVVLGALLVLVMGFPLAMMPAVLYPLFQKRFEILAIGAIVFRGVLEAVTYILLVLLQLALLPIGRAYVGASAAEMVVLDHMVDLVQQASYWTEHILAIVFTLGAMMIYWMFHRLRLLPPWLALWGLIGAVLYFIAPIGNAFNPERLPLSLGIGWGWLMIPLALQEMVLAVWLIVKGFRSPQPVA